MVFRKIAFIHPDLGIGGAERLICDAALALQSEGHTVKIFTSHHDPHHCFSETANGTLSVDAIGDWLPRKTFNKCYAFWAYVRMIYVSFYMIFVADFTADVIICDQVSACIPILKLSKKAKVLFYCHFPDMLLTQRKTMLKKIYRAPIDQLEEFTTGLADLVVVNSKFTSQIFEKTFTSLSHIKPTVLYPSLNFDSFTAEKVNKENILKDLIPNSAKVIFLSINRYERKKNLTLAIKAFKELQLKCDSLTWKDVHLIVAGGYDDRVEENKQYHLELETLALSFNLKDKITFMKSFSDDQKLALLSAATCLLYTPSNEHFGIVPIEAMFMKCPAVACASGGPLETVKHEVTGYLCQPEAESFAESMSLFLSNTKLKNQLGDAGHKHVVENFSFHAFTQSLNSMVEDLSSSEPTNQLTTRYFYYFVFIAISVIITFYFSNVFKFL